MKRYGPGLRTNAIKVKNDSPGEKKWGRNQGMHTSGFLEAAFCLEAGESPNKQQLRSPRFLSLSFQCATNAKHKQLHVKSAAHKKSGIV
jgi:hypothetical protein